MRDVPSGARDIKKMRCGEALDINQCGCEKVKVCRGGLLTRRHVEEQARRRTCAERLSQKGHVGAGSRVGVSDDERVGMNEVTS